MRIGVMTKTFLDWAGGRDLLRSMINSLIADDHAIHQFYILISKQELALSKNDFEEFVGKLDCKPEILIYHHTFQGLYAIAQQHEIDVIIPSYWPLGKNFPIPWVGCICDLQHKFHPEFFSVQERNERDKHFTNVMFNSVAVLALSQHVKDSRNSYYPGCETTLFTLPFYPMPVSSSLLQASNINELRNKYNLREKYFLISNQFWIHKNHAIAFKAVSLLKDKYDFQLVCTGTTSDYRFPDYYSSLVNQINELGISEQVRILGYIPKEEQLAIMQQAVALIQPTLFEGSPGGLAAAEAASLGTAMILSDIPVNLEVNLVKKDGIVYFEKDSPVDLSVKMEHFLQQHEYSPNPHNDVKPLATALQEAMRYVIDQKKLQPPSHTSDSNHSVHNKIITPSMRNIVIATSISPYDIGKQQIAIDSWLKMGFQVISINAVEEIQEMQDHFPNVEFCVATTTGKQTYGKPYVRFDEIMRCLYKRNTDICGIVNSDIYLSTDRNFYDYIKKEANRSLVYGPRVEVDDLSNLTGKFYLGFDFFFFDRRIIEVFPDSKLYLGLCWWDYWVPLICAVNNLPVKLLITPVAFHVTHPRAYDDESWIKIGLQLGSKMKLPFALNRQTVSLLQEFIFHIIQKKSKRISL